jgi:hypothetical protein
LNTQVLSIAISDQKFISCSGTSQGAKLTTLRASPTDLMEVHTLLKKIEVYHNDVKHSIIINSLKHLVIVKKRLALGACLA